MEKFYEVTQESTLYNRYFEWFANLDDVNQKVKEFMSKHNIETNQYYAGNTIFYIIPTSNDKINFAGMLTKKVEASGLIAFKKNSSIGTDWANMNVKVVHKPVPSFEYFNDYLGKTSSRLFHDGNTKKVYCSITPEYEIKQTQKGFVELKGSEFFKVIEDIESR